MTWKRASTGLFSTPLVGNPTRPFVILAKSILNLSWMVFFQIRFIFTRITWGNDPIWRSYFSTELVQPPTSKLRTRFEIYVGEDLIWSTLTRHRSPNLQAEKRCCFKWKGPNMDGFSHVGKNLGGFWDVVVHDLVALNFFKVFVLVVCMFSMIMLLLASLPLIFISTLAVLDLIVLRT